MVLMRGMISTLTEAVGRWWLSRNPSGGIDLRKLRYLPSSFTMPLRRDGIDPLPRLVTQSDGVPAFRRHARVLGRNVWLVTGYDEACAVLADSESFSNDMRGLVPQEGRSAEEQIGGLGMTDPPDHTVLRRVLTPEFTMRRLKRLEPAIRSIVDERLEAMAADGPEVDLVSEFAFGVPFEVICQLLGVPHADRAAFHRLGAARFDLSTGGVGAFGAAEETREFLIHLVRELRANPPEPSEDEGLLPALVREHPELDDIALGGLADGVFLGGYETSASMLALGAHVLMQHPDVVRRMREEPEYVEPVVEELLRLLTVVQMAFLRFARRDLTLFGEQVREGDCVAVSLLAADRDPRMVERPDDFDPDRAAKHVAFGHGMHRCLGAELARMELRIALRELVCRFPELTPAGNDLGWRQLSIVYGIDRLPVRLGAPALT
jgi:cytochrome P450